VIARDAPVLPAVRTLVGQYPRYGYRTIRIVLEREGHVLGIDRMYRLWRQEGLQVPKKRPRRRVATGRPRPLLYTCAGTQCGEQDGWFGHFYLYPLGKHLSQTPAHSGSGGPAGQVSEYVLSSPVNQRYLAAKRSRPEGDVYVSVYVATSRWNYHKDTADHPIILLDVIDAVPIETGMVTIDAAAMAKGYLEQRPRRALRHLFRHGQGGPQA
jgi:hypothetical protein